MKAKQINDISDIDLKKIIQNWLSTFKQYAELKFIDYSNKDMILVLINQNEVDKKRSIQNAIKQNRTFFFHYNEELNKFEQVNDIKKELNFNREYLNKS